MLSISTIEQAAPKAYIRTLFFYNLPENYSKEFTMKILREGLMATVEAIPLLSAKLVFDGEGKQIGKVAISPGTFDYFFELKRNNFPTAPLSGELLFPWPALYDLTTAKPVFGVQANFIEGGLILGVCISHNKADARAIYEITQAWSHNCRDLQNKALPSLPKFGPEIFANGPLTHSDKVAAASHPEYVIAKEPSIPPGLLKGNWRTKVYYFSPQKLEELKVDCTPDDRNSWVSTNDALSALMWSSVIAAQVNLDDPPGGSFNSVCVDGRLRCSPKLSPHHIGCTMILVTPWAPIESILKHDIKTLAMTVHKSQKAVTPEYIENLLALYNSMPDLSCISPASFPGLVHNSIFETAWQKVPFYQVNWGSFMGGHCEAIRTAYTGFFNGTAVAMPTAGDIGIEVIIGLEKHNFEKLDKDKTWTKYATCWG